MFFVPFFWGGGLGSDGVCERDVSCGWDCFYFFFWFGGVGFV